jgi:hypothetical protein
MPPSPAGGGYRRSLELDLHATHWEPPAIRLGRPGVFLFLLGELALLPLLDNVAARLHAAAELEVILVVVSRESRVAGLGFSLNE